VNDTEPEVARNRAAAQVLSRVDGGRRRRPRQERARATVEAILQATVELIDTVGWTHTSTNRIAERAGVSIGSLYQYFPNKESILAEVVARHHEQVHSVVWSSIEELRDATRRLEEVLEALFRQLVAIHAADPALTRAVSIALPRRPSGEDDTDRFAEALERALRCRPDVLRPDARLAAHVVATSVEALTRWLAHDAPDGIDRDAAIAEITTLVARYLTI